MNKNGKFPDKFWNDCQAIWSDVQTSLKNVIRWTNRRKVMPGLRIQDCLQHSFSIGLLGDIVIIMLEPFVRLDQSLLSTAFKIHDFGEGELNRDIPFPEKTEDHDLQEYLAFCQRFKRLPKSVFEHFQRAFLLQFCLDPTDNFPNEAKEVMADLAKSKKMEALVFRAVEYWDYLLFALEQYAVNEDAVLLTILLKNHTGAFKKLKTELPGFEQLFWTEEIQNWCAKFCENKKLS